MVSQRTLRKILCLNKKTEALKISNLLNLFYKSSKKILLLVSAVSCENFFVFVYFLARYSVLATPLLMSPILRNVWLRTQRAAEASRRATNLATPSPCFSTYQERHRTVIFVLRQFFAVCRPLLGEQEPGLLVHVHQEPHQLYPQVLLYTPNGCFVPKSNNKTTCANDCYCGWRKVTIFSRMTVQILLVSCCAGSVTRHTQIVFEILHGINWR
jgi:hypothetical protein